MRRAVALIIDRNQIVNIAYEGTTIPSRTMFADYGSMAPFIDELLVCSPAKWTGPSALAAICRKPAWPTPRNE